ncbi:hypothetical protein P7K49_008894 [Saguinus oedipus]|uniref:Uncharacterized protein n=1 Tax=Saguinus oedipus TaxID=9490 RepID=A0ABQ9VZ20_SAGOE|nr:hypothetical protein P7K49_008894 [Saguinus oedipus]
MTDTDSARTCSNIYPHSHPESSGPGRRTKNKYAHGVESARGGPSLTSYCGPPTTVSSRRATPDPTPFDPARRTHNRTRRFQCIVQALATELGEGGQDQLPRFLQTEDNPQNRHRSAITETISEKPGLPFLMDDSVARWPQPYQVREKPLASVGPRTLHARRSRPGSSKSPTTEWPTGRSVIPHCQSPLTSRVTQALEPTNNIVATPTTKALTTSRHHI